GTVRPDRSAAQRPLVAVRRRRLALRGVRVSLSAPLPAAAAVPRRHHRGRRAGGGGAAAGAARMIATLARRRVPLGFVTAMLALVLARPTWTTWMAGLAVAIAGELIRVWAAGHLEKSREV